MTCKEKLMLEHPEEIDDRYGGGCFGCPSSYGYLPDPEPDSESCKLKNCYNCWDREIPETASSYVHSGDPIAKSEKVDIFEEGCKVTARPVIKDSGNRRQFASGAVRDMQEGKGRCDLMPLYVVSHLFVDNCYDSDPILSDIAAFQKTEHTEYLFRSLKEFCKIRYEKCISTMLLEVAKHFEEGAKKYGENNWQKGIPVNCYIDSAIRHYLKWRRGDKDEPHDRAFVWNLMCCIWEVDYREKTDG